MTEYGLTITRVFDAPRERVWAEWTDPEAFADWFGGPEAEVSAVTMDVRPGGKWRATMFSGPDRVESRWRGEYLEVARPERLVFTAATRPGAEHELVTVILRDLGDGRTEMLLEQRGHLPPEAYERAKRGWGVFFDRLDERLAL